MTIIIVGISIFCILAIGIVYEGIHSRRPLDDPDEDYRSKYLRSLQNGWYEKDHRGQIVRMWDNNDLMRYRHDRKKAMAEAKKYGKYK